MYTQLMTHFTDLNIALSSLKSCRMNPFNNLQGCGLVWNGTIPHEANTAENMRVWSTSRPGYQGVDRSSD